LSEPLGHSRLQLWSDHSQAQPVDPALFLCPHMVRPRIMLATPQLLNLSPFWPVLAPRKSQNSGQANPAPVAPTGGRSDQSGTLQEATGGTQTHSRRTGSKLGRLHRARQALVRVPESNTKYGGKRGKPGGPAAPWLLPSISESSQIPKRKNCFRVRRFRASPAVHRATIYCVRGLALGRLRGSYGVAGWHARRPMASSSDNRQGAELR